MQENNRKQNIFLYDRQRAHLDGIEAVESFTETEIVALSSLGRILVEGENLKIDSVQTDTGIMEIHGTVRGFCYLEDKKETGGGFFSRFLR